MDNLLFIDHSYHKKTKSSEFFKDILCEDFKVIELWNESWTGNNNINAEIINKMDADYILFWQSLLSIDELKKIKNKKIIWVPMFDCECLDLDLFWWRLSSVKNFKVISFSLFLEKKIKKFGFNVLYCQYFPKIDKNKIVKNFKTKRLFFWQRTNFGVNDLKRFINFKEVDEFVYKMDPDPGYKRQDVTTEMLGNRNIKLKIIEGDIGKERFLEELSKCNMFVAPRFVEGIGMSFLEAMAMGIIVIGCNYPTMNEYINDSVNGYLVSDKPFIYNKIDLGKLEEISKKSIKKSSEIRIKWNNLIKNGIILDFIKNKTTPESKLNVRLTVRFLVSLPMEAILIIYFKCFRRFIKFF